jgi:biotin operon repressor
MKMLNVVMVRALRGAPLSCLVALALSNNPVGCAWLTRVTGYSDKPISEALKTLREFGLVDCNGRYDGWRLVESVQLPFVLENGSRNNSVSLPTTTTTTIEETRPEQKQKERGSRKNSDSIINELRKAKIFEPTASQLAELSWVTLEYIRAHIDQARRDGVPTGLLVHRIRSGDDMPERQSSSNPRRYIEGEYASLIAH